VGIQNPPPDLAETCWTAEILNDSESTHDDTEANDVSTVTRSSTTRRIRCQFVYARLSSCNPGTVPSIAHAAYYFGVIKVRRSRDPCPNQIAKAHAQAVGLLLKRVLLRRQESNANKGSPASTFRPSHTHLIHPSRERTNARQT
jgi:hypothetical protein